MMSHLIYIVIRFLIFAMTATSKKIRMLLILSFVLILCNTVIAAPGATLASSSSSLSRGRTSSFGGSGRIPGEHDNYPARRPQQQNFIATKSKIWDRKEVEQKRTNNALRAHTAVLTTAGNAAAGVVKASVQHLGNKMNIHATPEQKSYSRNVLRDARHNLISAPKQVHKEAYDILHNSKVRKDIVVNDYREAKKGGNPYHQRPYTHEENNKLASTYHKENKDFYAKVHARNQDLSHPGTVQGHAAGYSVSVGRKV